MSEGGILEEISLNEYLIWEGIILFLPGLLSLNLDDHTCLANNEWGGIS